MPRVVVSAQLAQVSLHASWQQTPSVQKPLAHSVPVVHLALTAFEVPGMAASVMVTAAAPVGFRTTGAAVFPVPHISPVASIASNWKLNEPLMTMGTNWNVR